MSSPPDAPSSGSSRRAYIDWARGIAVLIMIEAHVLDAWTVRSQRDSAVFSTFNLLGGLAAPLFLWLAGLSLVLAAEQKLARTGNRQAAAAAVVRRGAEIFVLAFGFRLQAFIVSPGNPLVSLLRVDILNVMGPAIMLAAFVWGASRNTRGAAIALGALAVATAMVTPLVRNASWLPALPPVVQWYLSPNGNHSTFTLFPWSGFLFAGAVIGLVLAGTARQIEGRAILWIAGAAALLIAANYGASLLPSIYTESSFWHTSPTYFGIRAGILMLVLAALFAIRPAAALAPGMFGVLATFGRHSLFVYWIHVELVYGYATMLLHRRLPLWGVGIAYVAFCCAMYWATALKNRVVKRWQAGAQGQGHPQPIGASARG